MLALVDVIFEVRREAEDGNPFECVDIASEKDPEIWVQITSDMINVSYPFGEKPAELLERLDVALPPDFELVEWEPELHATWEHNVADPDTIAAFALDYLAAVYGDSGIQDSLVFERNEM